MKQSHLTCLVSCKNLTTPLNEMILCEVKIADYTYVYTSPAHFREGISPPFHFYVNTISTRQQLRQVVRDKLYLGQYRNSKVSGIPVIHRPLIVVAVFKYLFFLIIFLPLLLLNKALQIHVVECFQPSQCIYLPYVPVLYCCYLHYFKIIYRSVSQTKSPDPLLGRGRYSYESRNNMPVYKTFSKVIFNIKINFSTCVQQSNVLQHTYKTQFVMVISMLLTLREECSLRVFEYSILSRILGPKRDENGE